MFGLSLMQILPLGPFPYIMNVVSTFEHHESQYDIPNAWGMTGEMLSFHELLQYFRWHRGKRVQIIQTILSIIWMANRKEVGDHPGSEMRTDVLLSVGSNTYLDSEKDN